MSGAKWPLGFIRLGYLGTFIRLLIFSVFLSGNVSFAASFKLPTVKSAVAQNPEVVSKLSSLPTPEQDRESEKVLLSLISQSGWFPELKIHVENGVLTLEGDIRDQSQMEWLLQAADRLPSILAVINRTSTTKASVSNITPLTREIDSWLESFEKALPGLIAALLLLIFFVFISRFLTKFSHRLWSYRIENPFLLTTIAKLSLLPVYLLMFYMILLTMGMKNLATTIIGGTGVLGLVLGLAFKDIAENFFSGILLATRSPFTKGDLIQVGDIKGIVQNLNMRGTTVMDPDGTLILIPNSTVVQSVVYNISANPKTRTSFTVGIGFENSISEAQKIILQVIASTERVLKDPPPLVMVDQLGTSSVSLRIYFWFDMTNASLIGVRSRVMSACKEALLAAGVRLPDDHKEFLITDASQVSLNKTPPKALSPSSPVSNDSTAASRSQETHDEMMKGQLPEQTMKAMAENVSLPGNSQSPDLLKKNKES